MRIFHLLSGFLLAAMALTLVGAAADDSQPFTTQGHPALEAINEAYLAGQITEAEALLYRFYFVKDPERLPVDFRLEGDPIKCATPILLEVLDRAPGLPVSIREQILDNRTRPWNLPETIETDHFVVHYALTGPDAVSTAYAQVVSDACEHSWQAYHVDLTWEEVPGDGYLGGGMDLTDCYIHYLGAGYLGLAEPENLVTSTPEPWDKTGFFHVNSSIGSTNVRRVTTAHEFMHVVQFGYNASAGHWYMENCAMMGEEFAYDDINDYRGYLYAFFSSPHKALYTFNGSYEYGGIVWPMYKSERFYVNMVEEVWAGLRWTYDIWSVFGNVLGGSGYTMFESFCEFMRWCFYTGNRDHGMHFEEGGEWYSQFYPTPVISSYPSGEVHPHSNRLPEAFGTSLMKFNPEPSSSDNILTIQFDGYSCPINVEFVLKEDGNLVFHEYVMEVDEYGDGYIEIPGFDTAEYVVSLVSNDHPCGPGRDYAVWADTYLGFSDVDEQLQMGDVVRIYPNCPNPASINTMVSYSIPANSDVTVRIFDSSGRAVRDLFSDHQYAGHYEVGWDTNDNRGQPVANGVYFAHITISGKDVVRDVTVIR